LGKYIFVGIEGRIGRNEEPPMSIENPRKRVPGKI
jgi:hypothetical protein